MPKKPQRRPSPDILPDSLPPQRREEEPDVRREAPETPDSLPGETDPGRSVEGSGNVGSARW